MWKPQKDERPLPYVYPAEDLPKLDTALAAHAKADEGRS